MLRLQRAGLLFAGLPCGSFVYLSQGTHRRHSTRWGQEQYEFVAQGNKLGSRFAFLAALATVREVFWAIENPLRTHLFWLPPLCWLLRLPIGAIAARWCPALTPYNNIYAVLGVQQFTHRLANFGCPLSLLLSSCVVINCRISFPQVSRIAQLINMLRWMGCYGGISAKPQLAVGTAQLTKI